MLISGPSYLLEIKYRDTGRAKWRTNIRIAKTLESMFKRFRWNGKQIERYLKGHNGMPKALYYQLMRSTIARFKVRHSG